MLLISKDPSYRGTTDQLDAAEVPPSVFVEHQGEPEILHDDTSNNRAMRNAPVPPQEQLSGV
jgi:hypothetical protein